MRKMKKLLSILVAATMTLAMAAPSFADSTDPAPTTSTTEKGSIEITNAIQGESYTIHKIFNLTYAPVDPIVDPDTGESVAQDPIASYTVEDAWVDFVKEGGAGAAYIAYDPLTKTATWKTEVEASDENAEAFAKAALAYATGMQGTTIKAGYNEDVKDETFGDADGVGSIRFTGLDLGYYVVDSTVGTLVALNSTTPDKQITDKNEMPTFEKKVQAPNDTTDKYNTNANVGDTVNFTVTINAKVGAKGYVLTDTMNKMTLVQPENGSTFTVKAGDTTLMAGTDYTPNVDETGKNITLTISDSYLETIQSDTIITVEYSATIDADAVTGTNIATNTAALTYGNGAEAKPVDGHNETKVYSYGFNLKKTASEGAEEALEGAQFKLYTALTDGDQIYVVKNQDGTYQKTSTPNDVVIEAGTVVIKGLAVGDYYLEETKAPNGYNKLNERKLVEVRGADNATDDNANTIGNNVEVVNHAGSLLPSTGGIGTTIFYAAGIILMAGAVFFVVRRRRA